MNRYTIEHEGKRFVVEAASEAEALSFLQGETIPSDEIAPFPSPDQIAGMVENQSLPNVGRRMGQALDLGTSGAAFSAGSKLEGMEGVLLGKMPGEGYFNYGTPAGERYEANRDAFQGRLDAARDEHGGMATAMETLGAVAGGGGLAKQGLTFMRGGGAAGSALVRGLLEGGAYAGAHAAGAAKPGNALVDALTAAVPGAVAGGAVSGGSTALVNALTRRAATKAIPSTQQLMREGGDALNAAREANPRLEGFDRFAMQMYQRMPDEAFHPRAHPQIKILLDELETLTRKGTAVEYRDWERLRKLTKNATGSMAPEERRLGMIFRNALDDFAAQADGPNAAMTRDARAKIHRGKKAETIAEALEKGERRAASTGSGGNTENAIRQNVRAILDSPRKRRGYSADEIEIMEAIVRGTPVQNVLRRMGRMSPQSGGLSAWLGVMGAAYDPMLAIPSVVGGIAQPASQRATMQNAALLDAMIRGGAKALPKTPEALPPARDALVRALASQVGD